MQISYVTLQGFEFHTSRAKRPDFSMAKVEKEHDGTELAIDCWVFDQ